MARRGKALTFEDEELRELVELQYGGPRTFALLSLLFPFVDSQHHFHVDHIFPKALFRRPSLRKAGLSEEAVELCQESRDGLANLQLLEGTANIEKQQALPAAWLAEMYPDAQSRSDYCDKHLLGNVPLEIGDFPKFFEERKERLRERIGRLLERSGPASDGAAAAQKG
jgi:hypothetical protein